MNEGKRVCLLAQRVGCVVATLSELPVICMMLFHLVFADICMYICHRVELSTNGIQ